MVYIDGFNLAMIIMVVLIIIAGVALIVSKKNHESIIGKLFLWFLFPSAIALSINYLFYFYDFIVKSGHNISVLSLIGTKETQQLVISVSAAILIAYFQYRIQGELQSKNENELKAQRLRESINFNEIKGRAINFRLVAAQISHSQVSLPAQIDELLYLIELYSDNIEGIVNPFCQAEVINKSVVICKDGDMHSDIRVNAFASFSNGRFLIWFTTELSNMDAQDDALLDFFCDPLYPDERKSKKNLIKFSSEIKITDKSSPNELDFSFNFTANITPCGGYNEHGEFGLLFSEPQLHMIG